MTKKAAAKPQKPFKERIVLAAFDLSARLGWDMITMADIADKAHVTLADLADHFDDKSDILAAYGRMIDKRVLETASAGSPDETPRDRLFDILMERFDILGENRAALISVLSSFKLDPKQGIISLPHLGRSMNWMLEAAGVDTSGVKGAIRVAGLVAVYLNVLRVWIKDDSADLSKTMAALDKNLGRAEQCANTFMF